MPVYRIYVEKKNEYAVEAHGVLADLKVSLNMGNLESLRLLNRYDVEEMSRDDFEKAVPIVFSEPQVDLVYDELPQNGGEKVFAIEYLPGQYDQRADSCAQCIQILTTADRPRVKNARVYLLSGKDISKEQLTKIKEYLINPVESREASLEKFTTLEDRYAVPTEVTRLDGFIRLEEAGLEEFLNSYGLAMDLEDVKFCQNYFKNQEKRDPTITEIRMIDTYWSDHCRHTTFLTHIDGADIRDKRVAASYQKYLDARKALGRENKPVTLMDMATAGVRILKAQGSLPDLDESEEINACSVKIKVPVDGKDQDWLLMFKNETHNHPTEIEPFGGAATCLGGAIRDPLSGRSYVYQAMRVTGSADPRLPFEQTMKGKLPQKKITVGAAAGYSSYGNQIGLATGLVHEIYHPGYMAKRMEIGAVIGAAPAGNVRRECPDPGDVVILLGGRTGRDGCGGATGSSKSHTLESLEHCGAEVQKGNPPEERKLQRLFRDPKVTAMIKRCNDFGAGGVSVAIGELADGLEIDLSAVPKKYDGLDGTELAISESQERMAVVVAPEDAQAFIRAANGENLEATSVAKVTAAPRLKMNWNGSTIVDLSREFLNSNGAEKHARISVEPCRVSVAGTKANVEKQWKETLSSLSVCAQKGLAERFDSSIGASTVLMPFGGARQLTPSQVMAAKLPVLNGETTLASLMAYGYNPELTCQSPYHGAMYAVIESVAKVIAAGGSRNKCWLTFQEYFERLKDEPSRWGKPFSALLGALEAQLSLKTAAIGGKDSMSGSFEDLDVPPTLVSFAVSVADAKKVVSSEFKLTGSKVVLIKPEFFADGTPDFDSVTACFDRVEALIAREKVRASWCVTAGGIAEGISKMAFGNRIGFAFEEQFPRELLFAPCPGAFLLEVEEDVAAGVLLGRTAQEASIKIDGKSLDLDKLCDLWLKPLASVFPLEVQGSRASVAPFSYTGRSVRTPAVKIAKPRVLIPIFPGTNCEYDSARAFEKQGALAEIFVVRNLTAAAVEESVIAFEKAIRSSQIVMIPGGFSGGDEPDGSGKFITAFFRNPAVRDAVEDLLKNRNGLMLGICNGFQALIKLGLVPFGEIRDTDAACPTLTFNTIGRHQSMMVNTRVSSVKSPWFARVNAGEIYTAAISHGEGRFVAGDDLMEQLIAAGQIVTQYVDLDGRPTMAMPFNPNGSMCAVEGICSPDGRVLGKMAHNERYTDFVAKNVPGAKDMQLFRAGVEYFK